MKSYLSWQYDEFKQVGRDYGEQLEVDRYDSSHAEFRDVAAENNAILDAIAISPSDRVIDFGCGTGDFALQASLRCKHVYAVDVSETMLSFAKAKAEKAGISNISFHHAGFLTYSPEEQSADAIVTTFAFHHLPDFWKGVALNRLYRLLKPGGRFYLRDVILPEHHALENIAAFIEKQAAIGGDFLREDAEGHFRDEYSTYEWVMDGLLERSGFVVKHKSMQDGILGTYLCQR